MAQLDIGSRQGFRIAERLLKLDWFLIVLVCTIGAVGIGMLISASGGSTEPWASRQMVWFGAGLLVMIAVALIDIGFWLRAAYTIYGLAFALLVGVDLLGAAGKGAQRWIDLGVIQLQPSELMKIALILALARYFHGVPLDGLGRIRTYLPPLLMILAPAALILRQPDLGTALLLAIGGGIMLFLAGIKAWKIGVGIALTLGSGPVAWQFLHEYQKARILTFFNPEADPLGAGYHILQSKIALGSGGLFGKGYLQGTQSHLNFLPEKQTDFIFTMMAEELGFFGVAGVLLLYLGIATYGVVISARSNNHFGRLLGMGITVTFFFHVFFNVAMVIGLIPIVGLPLPLISYGGSAMLSLMLGLGLLLCVGVHRDVIITRRPGSAG